MARYEDTNNIRTDIAGRPQGGASMATYGNGRAGARAIPQGEAATQAWGPRDNVTDPGYLPTDDGSGLTGQDMPMTGQDMPLTGFEQPEQIGQPGGQPARRKQPAGRQQPRQGKTEEYLPPVPTLDDWGREQNGWGDVEETPDANPQLLAKIKGGLVDKTFANADEYKTAVDQQLQGLHMTQQMRDKVVRAAAPESIAKEMAGDEQIAYQDRKTQEKVAENTKIASKWIKDNNLEDAYTIDQTGKAIPSAKLEGKTGKDLENAQNEIREVNRAKKEVLPDVPKDGSSSADKIYSEKWTHYGADPIAQKVMLEERTGFTKKDIDKFLGTENLKPEEVSAMKFSGNRKEITAEAVNLYRTGNADSMLDAAKEAVDADQAEGGEHQLTMEGKGAYRTAVVMTMTDAQSELHQWATEEQNGAKEKMKGDLVDVFDHANNALAGWNKMLTPPFPGLADYAGRMHAEWGQHDVNMIGESEFAKSHGVNPDALGRIDPEDKSPKAAMLRKAWDVAQNGGSEEDKRQLGPLVDEAQAAMQATKMAAQEVQKQEWQKLAKTAAKATKYYDDFRADLKAGNIHLISTNPKTGADVKLDVHMDKNGALVLPPGQHLDEGSIAKTVASVRDNLKGLPQDMVDRFASTVKRDLTEIAGKDQTARWNAWDDLDKKIANPFEQDEKERAASKTPDKQAAPAATPTVPTEQSVSPAASQTVRRTGKQAQADPADRAEYEKDESSKSANMQDAYWAIKKDVLKSRHGVVSNDPEKTKKSLVDELMAKGVSEKDANALIDMALEKASGENFSHWKSHRERTGKLKTAAGIAAGTVSNIPEVLGETVNAVAGVPAEMVGKVTSAAVRTVAEMINDAVTSGASDEDVQSAVEQQLRGKKGIRR